MINSSHSPGSARFDFPPLFLRMCEVTMREYRRLRKIWPLLERENQKCDKKEIVPIGTSPDSARINPCSIRRQNQANQTRRRAMIPVSWFAISQPKQSKCPPASRHNFILSSAWSFSNPVRPSGSLVPHTIKLRTTVVGPKVGHSGIVVSDRRPRHSQLTQVPECPRNR